MYLGCISLFEAYLKSTREDFFKRAALQSVSHPGLLSTPRVIIIFIIMSD